MKKIVYAVISLICIFIMTVAFSGCNISDPEPYDQIGTLKRAKEKELTGAPLTRQEERELKSYNKWEKEYDARQYNERYY